MQLLNEKIAALSVLRDYMPIARTIAFVLFMIHTSTFFMVHTKSMHTVMWCISAGLSLVGYLAAVYVLGSYNRLLKSELSAFNKQDEAAQITWEVALADGFHAQTVSCDASKRSTEIPRRILIKHTDKCDVDVEFLPAYLPAFSTLLGDRVRSVGRSFLMHTDADKEEYVHVEEDNDFLSFGRMRGLSRPPSYKTTHSAV
ncbi:hypothetical protein BDR26DRAFT_858299 [Obelidium mucronatum]|nr:hypothetical protein BDR26DRAFT_858299 [Obelidium mucronatum]